MPSPPLFISELGLFRCSFNGSVYPRRVRVYESVANGQRSDPVRFYHAALGVENAFDPAVHVRRMTGDSSTVEKAKAFEDFRVVLRDQSRHRIDGFEEFDTDKTPGGDWHSLYRNLAGVLAGTEELIVKPRQVLNCMKVIDAAFRSSREGVTVRL